ncbi:aspartate ammonia-lyase [Campylobacter jejuni subsp. jejuni 327]|nr:aspartate ammonia-lyase [Campylobacter jejuni subsp. jejuni 327]
MEYRVEHDTMGEVKVPNDKYWGAQTERSFENFKIGCEKMPKVLIYAFANLKKSLALVNNKLGKLDDAKKNAIVQACDEIIAGKFDDNFPLAIWQTGSGTQSNMNMNEVIANRATEIMGGDFRKEKLVHPNDHVNLSQSTNDAYPTALHLALHDYLSDLAKAMEHLKKAYERKAEEFKDVLKMGRTQLQDAVPMTLGREFKTFAVMIGEDIQRVLEARKLILEINLGGTAIGTGINSHPDYPKVVERKIREVTGFEYTVAEDLIEATQDTGAYVQISGVLKRVATKLSKVCNDLRLLSSGPKCGLNEINLPKMQPGSSIMPGKVNPVIPEVVNQVCYFVIGADVTVTFACEGGQLQLNVFEPVAAYSLFNSIVMLEKAMYTLADKCIDGITANEKICSDFVYNSVGIVTALNPYIGYENSASIAKEAMNTGKRVADIALERGLLSKEQIDEILTPSNMLNPHMEAKK